MARYLVAFYFFSSFLTPEILKANFCSKAFSNLLVKISPKKSTDKRMAAKDLAKLIALDRETQKLLENPAVAQYIFAKYFAPEFKEEALRLGLMEISKEAELRNLELYKLVNETLKERLEDPKLKKLVAENTSLAKELQPSSYELKKSKALNGLTRSISIFSTISKMKDLTSEGMSVENMDVGLFDFYGATNLGVNESQLRPWKKVAGGLDSIGPHQTDGVDPFFFAEIAKFASETEAPIESYSTNSGEALRGLLPSVSKFMGKTLEELQAYDLEKSALEGLDTSKPEFCSNIWCREENRHEHALSVIAERLTGRVVTEPITYAADKMGDFSDVDFALKHLLGRNSSEWNANSVYFYLAANSTGGLKTLVENIRADETKHMAVFSAAFKYLYGNQFMLRTKGMIEKIVALAKEAKESNSNASVLESSPVTVFEIGVAHVLVEHRVRKYLKSLPLKTLAKIFDSPVLTIADVSSEPLGPEKEQTLRSMVDRERESRQNLSRWKKSSAKKQKNLEKFEHENQRLISSLVLDRFKSFDGGEVYNSTEALDIIKQIDALKLMESRRENLLLRRALKENLRDYQIMNNKFVRSRDYLKVEWAGVARGFDVRRFTEAEARIIKIEELENDFILLQVEKKDHLKDVSAGDAFQLSLKIGEQVHTRYLSLANPPEGNQLEFSFKMSESEFKQFFIKNSNRQNLSVELKHLKDSGLKYDATRPLVMLAGGVGITPFRSIINPDTLAQSPEVHLVHINKEDSSFQDYFRPIEKIHTNFKFTEVRTADRFRDPGSLEARGSLSFADAQVDSKLDKKLLAQLLKGVPMNAQFLVVGSAGMVAKTEELLLALGQSKDSILLESFLSNTKSVSVGEGENSVVVVEEQNLCLCHNVTEATVKSMIEADADLAKIQEVTMAGTGCGNCLGQIETLRSKHDEDKIALKKEEHDD